MRDAMRPMLPSESTLRSAAPTSLADPSPKKEVERVVVAGGTLVELHPPRMGQADVMIEGGTIAQVGGQMPDDVPRVDASGCFVMPAFVVAQPAFAGRPAAPAARGSLPAGIRPPRAVRVRANRTAPR